MICKKSVLTNSSEANLNESQTNPTTGAKLAELADVSEKTYRMGVAILNSDKEEIKQEVLSGKKSINKGYQETFCRNIGRFCF